MSSFVLCKTQHDRSARSSTASRCERRTISLELSTAIRQRADAILVILDPFTFLHVSRIAELALDHKLPSLYGAREFVFVGGLLAYGPNALDMYRRSVAVYVDKIFKGANPAELPVQQPTNFELVINMNTAKALGVTMPPSLLVRADHVIE